MNISDKTIRDDGEKLRNNTCFFTGHRSISSDKLLRLQADIDKTIIDLREQGITDFICGGAIGFDTLSAGRVAVMKKRNPGIKLILMLPCRDQTNLWSDMKDLKMYQLLKGVADEIYYISDMYTKTCMHERNRAMADASSVCVAYYSGRAGGTAYTVKYAENHGLTVINLWS